MSWFNGKILNEEDIKTGTFEKLPAAHQVGQPVHVWLHQDDGSVQPVPAVIAAVQIARNHVVTYDLAFQIGNTGLYAVVSDFRGFVTALGEGSPGYDGGLVDMQKVHEQMQQQREMLKPPLTVLYGSKPDELPPGCSRAQLTLVSRQQTETAGT